MDRDKARKRAKAADAALKKGKRFGPLHGVPMTIKESFQVAGSPTTWGVPGLKDNVTAETAVSAQRMIDAGVTLFGKMQRAGHACGLAELQSDLRHDRKSVGHESHAGRFVRRLGGCARCRPHRHRRRQRHRRLDPQSGALLRRVRPQADLRAHHDAQPFPARHGHGGRTSRRSGPSPARRRISRRRSTSWPGPIPTTAGT